jgi:DNA-binding transcriptional LysR family regulator
MCMLLDQLNINNLRVFEQVYTLKSMTLAAKEMGLTQSGVSQHIKNLEEFIEKPLFNRYKKRLLATEHAKDLYDSCSQAFLSIEKSLHKLIDTHNTIDLTLKIGLPVEFGNNIVIPKLAKLYNKYPKLKFHFIYEHADKINKMLLNGDLHIGFVDDYNLHEDIKHKTIYNEELLLCAHEDYIGKKSNIELSRNHFESFEYLNYVADKFVVSQWFKIHFNFKNLNLNYRAQLMDVQGMASMIINKMGVGILPKHIEESLKKRGHKILSYKDETKKYLNPIRAAWLPNSVKSPNLNLLLNEILASF